MSPIGGYLELELSKGNHLFHSTPYSFKSGRSSLHFILKVLQPSVVYIPFYTCNALLEPFIATGVTYKFYGINEVLEPELLPDLQAGEYFLYINYFDLKREVVTKLSEKYADQLIVDCTQAFFMKGNGRSWFFNSCRKFFGVPDGSYLYVPEGFSATPVQDRNEDYYIDHLIKRFNGHPAEGYRIFLENEKKCGSEIMGMSKLSEYLLSNIDFAQVAERRIGHFKYLQQVFSESNLLQLSAEDGSVPMCYPLLVAQVIDKQILFDDGIYIPTYWLDVYNRGDMVFPTEHSIANRLLPLPIDQRYGVAEMERLVKALKFVYDEFRISQAS